jgi:hypothetical protein
MKYAGNAYPKQEKGSIQRSIKRSPYWWFRFRDQPLTALDPGIFWTVGYVTHKVKDISHVLNDADVNPAPEMSDSLSLAQKIPSRLFYPARSPGYDTAYAIWQRRLGSKAYMMRPYKERFSREPWNPRLSPEFKSSAENSKFHGSVSASNLVAIPLWHFPSSKHDVRSQTSATGVRPTR